VGSPSDGSLRTARNTPIRGHIRARAPGPRTAPETSVAAGGRTPSDASPQSNTRHSYGRARGLTALPEQVNGTGGRPKCWPKPWTTTGACRPTCPGRQASGRRGRPTVGGLRHARREPLLRHAAKVRRLVGVDGRSRPEASPLLTAGRALMPRSGTPGVRSPAHVLPMSVRR
jgi:hypothetical protein